MPVEKDTNFARCLSVITISEPRIASEELGSREDSGNRALRSVRIVYGDILVNVS